MEAAKDYIHSIEQGQYDERFAVMYGSNQVSFQSQRYQTLLKQASEQFSSDNILLFCGCGRAELGGNHTDHNHGNVLTAGIHLDILAAVKQNSEMTVSVKCDDFDDIFIDLNDLAIKPEEFGTPGSIIRGVAAGLKKRGYPLCGFDAVLHSTVPIGSGLSSSAAFEVLTANIINKFTGGKAITRLEAAAIAKEAENTYFGKPCGFMDQIACAYADILHIDFNDPDQPEITAIELDFEQHGFQLAIVNTGGDHADLTDEYAAIPKEMFAAAKVCGKQVGRELEPADFFTHATQIRNQAGDRAFLRLYHFLMENDRAVRQAKALKEQQLDTFIKLVNDSGNSSFKYLQNCVSIKDSTSQPIPAALLMTEYFLQGKGGCRVHGGGFAGTIQVLVPLDAFRAYKEFMEQVFGAGSVIPLHIRQSGFELFEQ